MKYAVIYKPNSGTMESGALDKTNDVDRAVALMRLVKAHGGVVFRDASVYLAIGEDIDIHPDRDRILGRLLRAMLPSQDDILETSFRRTMEEAMDTLP